MEAFNFVAQIVVRSQPRRVWRWLSFLLALPLLGQDGSVDSTFKPISTDQPIYRVGLQSDGKIIIAGNFGVVGTNRAYNVARLNPDGSFDPSFFSGTGLFSDSGSAQLLSLEVLSDDRIMVGGKFSGAQGIRRANLLRLLPNGVVDTNFLTDINGPVMAIAGGGKYAGGSFSQFWGVGVDSFAVLDANGAFDFYYRMWRPEQVRVKVFDTYQSLPGPVGIATIYSIKVLPPPGFPVILLAGVFPPASFGSYIYPNYTAGVQELSLFSQFERREYTPINSGEAVKTFDLRGTNKPVIGGTFPGGVRAFNAAGKTNDVVPLTLDSSWKYKANSNSVTKLLALPDDKVLIGGNIPPNGLVRVDSNGIPDLTFSASTVDVNGLNDMLIQPDNKILVVGGGLKAKAYTASILRLNVGVPPDPTPSITYLKTDTGLSLSWPAGYVVQKADGLTTNLWSDFATNSPAAAPANSTQSYFRLIKRP